MKKLLLAAFLFTAVYASAQNQIRLAAGTKIIAVTTNSSEADMGMGAQIKNNSVSTNVLTVTGVKDKYYELTNTVTKLKASFEAMGETRDYDSEKESDRNSEAGKAISEGLGKLINVTVDKFSGAAFIHPDTTKTMSEDNPMKEIMESFGNSSDDMMVAGTFMLVPAGKKPGDSWVVTDSTKATRSKRTYTLTSITDKIATIAYTTETDANNSVEIQGSQMDIQMNTKTKGIITSNTDNGLVIKKTSDADISGTLDIMGQSMPITAKSSGVTEYTIEK